MAIHINHFVKARPYLYHLTAHTNVVHIQEDMVLKSANTLYAEAGENGAHDVRRGPRYLTIGQRVVQIRDQDPLHAGNISFYDGWSIDDLVAHLNDHVFFWPGWEHGPVSSGKNHFARYASESPVVLRMPTADLLAANNGKEPLFCRYNSGAPRCTRGKGSPRGASTFLRANEFPLRVSNVVEVTFLSSVRLPFSTHKSHSLDGAWMPCSLSLLSGDHDEAPH